MMRLNHNTRSRSAQRGASAIIGAAALLLLLVMVVAGVDIGRLYLAQQALQRDANLAALDAVQTASGCGNGGVPGTLAAATDAVQASLKRNMSSVDNSSASLSPQSVMTGINGHPAVEVGRTVIDAAGIRQFEPLADGDTKPDSVRVNLTQTIPLSIIPGVFSLTPGLLQASATAYQPALGAFDLGTGILSLQGGALNAVLTGLLCANGNSQCSAGVNLLVANYQNLANVQVTLGQLATAVGVRSQDLSNLLSVNTTLPGALNGLSSVLSGTSSGISATVATALQQIASGGKNTQFPLSALIGGTVNQVAANVPFVDLPNLLLALGEAATADPSGNAKPIALPVSVSIPGVTDTQAFLRVGGGAMLSGLVPAVGENGPAQAKSSEITLMLRSQLDVTSSVSGALGPVFGLLGALTGINITSTPVKLGADIHVAQAMAHISSLFCPSANNANPIADLTATTSVADVSLGTFTGSASNAPDLAQGTAPLTTVSIRMPLLGTLVLAVDLNGPVSTTVGSTTQDLNPITDFTPVAQSATSTTTASPRHTIYHPDGAPPDNPVADNPQTIGSQNLLAGAFSTLANNLNLSVSTQGSSGVLGAVSGILGTLTNTLVGTLKSVIDQVLVPVGGLLDQVIDPLLRDLGIGVGNATVTMQSVVMSQPYLVSTTVPTPQAPPGG